MSLRKHTRTHPDEMIQHLKKISERSASLFLLLLLSVDFTFIFLHIVKHTLVSNSALFNKFSAYLDMYHFIKLFWVVILFACLLTFTRCSGYLAWVLVFTFFLFDDALLIHQNVGDQIAKNFAAYLPKTISSPPRLFELTALALAGSLLFALVAWAYFHNPQPFKKISKDIMLLIVALIFFGLIIDLAGILSLGPTLLFGLEIVEDAGEMIVYSLLLWYVFLLAIRNGKPSLFLHDLKNK